MLKEKELLWNSNVYFQQYGEEVKDHFVFYRETWKLIQGVIIYGFHLSYKWHNLHGVLPLPADRYKRSGGSCQPELV